MGIKEKGFAEWVGLEFPDVVRDLGQTDKSHFDVVCIDVNPLLHTCLRTAKNEARFVKALFADLDRCMRLTIPQGTVYLAVDGSPPLAKMKEQIRRRRSKKSSKHGNLDSSQITPGCTFQLRVTEYLHYYAARYLSTKYHTSSLRIIIDGAETPGEGEAKIMQYLFSHSAYLQQSQVAVFSGDSDVIIQSLLSPVKDIFVLRPGIASFAAFSTARLRQNIIAAVGGAQNLNTTRVILDFSVLVMFSGNDYIHKLRGGRMSKIWPVYKRFRLDAIKDKKWRQRYLLHDFDTFDFEVLQEVLVRIRRLTIKAAFRPDLTISLAMLGLSASETPAYVDTTALSDSDDDEPEPEPGLPSITREQKSSNYTKHIANYLESLLWTLRMYMTGQCPDVTFTQVGNYLTLEQLLTFIARDLQSTRLIRTPENHNTTALITILCTITLLSLKKIDLVPSSWHKVFSSEPLRILTQSMINDGVLSGESIRVQNLIYAMGEHIVTCVNPSSPVVQLLTFRQCPVVFSQSYRQKGAATRLRKLGTSHAELWSGVDVTLPDLEFDSSLFVINHYVSDEISRPEIAPCNGPERTSVWPFNARKPRMKLSTGKKASASK